MLRPCGAYLCLIQIDTARPHSRSGTKAERGIEWWQGSTEEQPALHARQQGRMQEQRQHPGEEPAHKGVAAPLRQEDTLGPELEAVQGTHVPFTQLLNGG